MTDIDAELAIALQVFKANWQHFRVTWTPDQTDMGDALYAGRRLVNFDPEFNREYDDNVQTLIASLRALKARGALK